MTTSKPATYARMLQKVYGNVFQLLQKVVFGVVEIFFSFKIDPTKDLDDNLDFFNKLVQYITNTCKKLSQEYKAVILLNTIPKAYIDIKTTIKYGRDTYTHKIVINFLRSKDVELKFGRTENSSKCLFLRIGLKICKMKVSKIRIIKTIIIRRVKEFNTKI